MVAKPTSNGIIQSDWSLEIIVEQRNEKGVFRYPSDRSFHKRPLRVSPTSGNSSVSSLASASAGLAFFFQELLRMPHQPLQGRQELRPLLLR